MDYGQFEHPGMAYTWKVRSLVRFWQDDSNVPRVWFMLNWTPKHGLFSNV